MGDTDTDIELYRNAVLEHAAFLGMTLPEDDKYLYIAEKALTAPVPEGWDTGFTEDGTPYYFDIQSGESLWEHPSDGHFREMFNNKKAEDEAKAAKGKATKPKVAKPDATNDAFKRDDSMRSDSSSFRQEAILMEDGLRMDSLEDEDDLFNTNHSPSSDTGGFYSTENHKPVLSPASAKSIKLGSGSIGSPSPKNRLKKTNAFGAPTSSYSSNNNSDTFSSMNETKSPSNANGSTVRRLGSYDTSSHSPSRGTSNSISSAFKTAQKREEEAEKQREIRKLKMNRKAKQSQFDQLESLHAKNSNLNDDRNYTNKNDLEMDDTFESISRLNRTISKSKSKNNLDNSIGETSSSNNPTAVNAVNRFGRSVSNEDGLQFKLTQAERKLDQAQEELKASKLDCRKADLERSKIEQQFERLQADYNSVMEDQEQLQKYEVDMDNEKLKMIKELKDEKTRNIAVEQELREQVENVQKQRDRIKDNLDNVRRELQKERQKAGSSQTDLSEYQQKYDEAESKTMELSKQLSEIQQSKEQLEKELRQEKEQLERELRQEKEQRKNFEQVSKQGHEAEEKMNELQDRISVQERVIEKKQNQLNDLKKNHRNELEEKESALDLKDDEIEEKKALLKEKDVLLKEKDALLEEKEQQVQTTRSKMKQVETTLQHTK
eukprot:TRINITY_DN10162_c0_g1_i2.p1 TRINITY_DN10162_c0_g1~~TRINITY_DN10162_c0_g1_i2.p1  ORF type:complete len:662 (-),score=211.65 TRINITY_DN10162_c0_g1_i2:252-2237(-)